jgi:hypothetical protein
MLLRQEPIVLDNLVSSPARGQLTAVGSVVQPGPPVAGSPRRATATATSLRWALLALPLGVGTALRAVSLYQSPAPSYREAALVTQVVELSRLGVLGSIELGRLGVQLVSLATPQLAVISTGSGAWGRAPTALGAVRESGIVLWLGVALLTFTLARRLGAERGWTVLALAVLAVCPAAIASARIAAPENVAGLWAMAALVLATGGRVPGRRSMGIDLAVTACLSVAVLSAPVALALLPTVLMSTARRGGPRRVALVGGSVLFATGLGAAALMATAAPFTLVGDIPALHNGWFDSWGGSGGGTEWPSIDVLTPLICLGCALLGLRSHRARPLAVGVLLLAPLAVLVGAPASGLTLPLVTALLAVNAPEWFRRRSAPIAGAALGVVCGLGWAVDYAALPAALTPPPTVQAMAWLRDHLPAGQYVLTDRRSRVALVAGTDSWNQISTIADCRMQDDLLHPTSPAHCDRSPWWIVDPAVRAGLPEHTTLVAEFASPDGARHIQVRSALNTTTPEHRTRE